MPTTMQPVVATLEGREYLTESVHYEPAPPEYVRSCHAVLPDPEWRFTDHAGHVHWWRDTARDWKPATALPTLHRLHAVVTCDGSCGEDGGNCGGYHQTMYACKVCAAWVSPRFVPDYAARTIGIRVPSSEPDRMRLELRGAPPESAWDRGEIAVAVLGRTGRGRVGEMQFGLDESASFTVDVCLDPM